MRRTPKREGLPEPIYLLEILERRAGHTHLELRGDAQYATAHKAAAAARRWRKRGRFVNIYRLGRTVLTEVSADMPGTA